MQDARREFRKSTRTPLKTAVELRLEGKTGVQHGMTANVSVSGMFVALDDPPPVGSLVRFALKLDAVVKVKGYAEVVWIRLRAEGPQLPAGMGVQFRYLEGDGAALLARRLEPFLR